MQLFQDLDYKRKARALHSSLKDHYLGENRIRSARLSTPRTIENMVGRFQLEEAISKSHRVFVKGAPGDGKTTMLTQYCSEYGAIAFALPLYHLGTQVTLQDPRELSLFISSWAKQDREFIDQVLGKPETLVAIDGIDEIADGAKRNRTMDWFRETQGFYAAKGSSFKLMYAASRWDTPAPEFEKYELTRLTEDQIAEVFTRQLASQPWAAARDRLGREIRFDESSADFIRGLGRVSYHPFLTYPSYLKLAAACGGFIDESFTGFIEKGVKSISAMTESLRTCKPEDREKVKEVDSLMRYLPEALEWIAMLGQFSGRRAVSETELLDIPNWNDNYRYPSGLSNVPREVRKTMLEVISKYSGFFAVSHHEGAEPYYYFTHLGLQEALVGRGIANRFMQMGSEREKSEFNPERYVSRWDDPWMRQPLLFMLATLPGNWAETYIPSLLSEADERFIADMYMFLSTSAIHYKLVEQMKPAYDKIYLDRKIDNSLLKDRLRHWSKELA
ncbi:MAG: hypothetical protein HGA85_08685 [Nanoarchaeota archaeon]|nr:hypothetical protein [Nanoarchaeota archaeon]